VLDSCIRIRGVAWTVVFPWAGVLCHALGMDEAWVARLKGWKDAPGAVLEQGLAYVRSSIGTLPFFASTSVDAAEGNPERDETHYFLVPDPGAESGYDLVERRRLPVGVGTVNSLPKVRVFHFHDEAGVAVLERMLLGKLAEERAAAECVETDFADRMESLGEEIDRQSNWVTGGLILVGGVVAIANPLLGVGIAAKALVPELGGKLTKFGLGAAAEKVRKIGASWRADRVQKEAKAEVKAMRPEMVRDPVLVFLDELVALGGKADPMVAELDRLPEWWRDRDQRLTMGVAAEVVEHAAWERWLVSVRERLDVVE